MKVYSLPSKVEALLFDIDNTLYSNDEYVRSQTEHLVRRFAEWKGVSYEKGSGLVEAEKQRYAAACGGKKTSLGNIMLVLGVSLEKNARWRDESFRPEDYLGVNTQTVETINKLASRYALAAVTNNTVTIGRRTLAALGLNEMIPVVVGLDTCLVSKPAAEPFQAALELLNVSVRRAVSIGDRYTVDIDIPLSMRMGGILVEKLSDLYELPAVLAGERRRLSYPKI